MQIFGKLVLSAALVAGSGVAHAFNLDTYQKVLESQAVANVNHQLKSDPRNFLAITSVSATARGNIMYFRLFYQGNPSYEAYFNVVRNGPNVGVRFDRLNTVR